MRAEEANSILWGIPEIKKYEGKFPQTQGVKNSKNGCLRIDMGKAEKLGFQKLWRVVEHQECLPRNLPLARAQGDFSVWGTQTAVSK